VEPLHLGFYALQDLVDRRRIGEPLPYGCQDGVFGGPTGHEQFVVTSAANGGETAVVPAALAAHLADGADTLSAVERSRQQVRGTGLDVAALPSVSGLWSAPQWPRAIDLLPTGRNRSQSSCGTIRNGCVETVCEH
jgi:hypothetical protein